MATVAHQTIDRVDQPRGLSGTPFSRAIDRLIYVLTAGRFVVVVLTGFIPDSLMKIEAVQTGQRPPFPLVLHLHALFMGSFLLLLLTQTILVATGRCDLHKRVGILTLAVAVGLVVVGFVLVPTMYQQNLAFLQTAPAEAKPKIEQGLRIAENIKLLQIRIGILFPLFLMIGARARLRNSGLHKRMMILGTAMTLPAGVDRITWLPHTMPSSPVSPDLYVLAMVAPMFIWDVVRNRGVHKAYWIWLAINIPFAIAVHGLWDTPWWHAAMQRLLT